MKKFIAVCFLVVVATFLSSCTNYCKKADQLRMEYKYDEAVKLYQKAADGGDAYAIWRLADAYANGLGVEFNQEKALELFKKSAEQDCEEAIIDLGTVYLYGIFNVPVDTVKGADLVNKIAEKSQNPYVLYRYAYLYLDGIENYFDKDHQKAVEIMERIKDKENPYYLLLKGEMYAWGTESITQDVSKARPLLEKAFSNGLDGAAYVMAATYMNQKDKDGIRRAIEWLKKGANVGNTRCMYYLATIYSSDDPEMQSYHNSKEAHSLLEKAAKCGNAAACVDLGSWYLDEDNVENDDAKAFEYFKLADKYGSTEGSRKLGQCYWNGWGCDKNVKEAEKYWTKAALEGDAMASYFLALRYTDGTFLWNEGNYKKYLELAAAKGYDFALFDLGTNYREGIFGYPKDKQISFSYLKKGADLGCAHCCDMLSIYYKAGIGCSKDKKKSEEYAKKAKELFDK